jgi:hypothetical protein
MRIPTGLVNRSRRLDGTAFDPATPFGPPSGRYRTVHYGVMLPGLREPLRFMNLIAVLGQPRIPIWRAEHLVTTSDADTVSLLTATGVPGSAVHTGYRLGIDCRLAADGSDLRFGADVRIEGRYPNFRVRRAHPGAAFDLRLTATRTVTHFAHLWAGRYDHWSLLCRYDGEFRVDGDVVAVAGLGNLEYARGTALWLPFRFFTYHVVNVDDRTQVLFGQVLGPRDTRVQHEIYVRAVDAPSRVVRRGVEFGVTRYAAVPRRTPDGRSMRLPEQFCWSAPDGRGGELVRIEGRACGDWAYGVGAGFAGSFRYTGAFRGESIEGIGYLEYIDGR